MKKRGISPLLSSVLLIAFVIVLFVLISAWIRRTTVEPTTAVAEEELGSALECMRTEIDVANACNDSISNVKLDVDNMGDISIEGVRVRLIDEDSASEMKFIEEAISSFDRLSVTSGLNFDCSDYDVDTWEIEVYPVISSGMCKEAMKTVSMKSC